METEQVGSGLLLSSPKRCLACGFHVSDHLFSSNFFIASVLQAAATASPGNLLEMHRGHSREGPHSLCPPAPQGILMLESHCTAFEAM